MTMKEWWAVDAALRGAWWSAKSETERECVRSLIYAWMPFYPAKVCKL